MVDPKKKNFLRERFQYQIALRVFSPPANEVLGKVMFLHLCAILFTGEGLHPGGGGLHPGGMGVCILGEGGLNPGGWSRPPANWILQDTVNKWVVHILLECILA